MCIFKSIEYVEMLLILRVIWSVVAHFWVGIEFLVFNKVISEYSWTLCLLSIEWCGNNIFYFYLILFWSMWRFFLNVFHMTRYIMKWFIDENFISAQIYLICWSKWRVEVKSWHLLYSMHFQSIGLIISFLMLFIKSAKSRLW